MPNIIPTADEISDAVAHGIRVGLRSALKPIAEEVATVRRGMRPALTVHEVAEILDCTPDRVMRFHVRKRGLQAYRPAKSATFLPSDVEAYVRKFPDGGADANAAA